MDKNLEELKLPQAALELQKDKTYLFVFDSSTGITARSANDVVGMLNSHGFHGMGVIVKNAKGLKVFEQNLETEE